MAEFPDALIEQAARAIYAKYPDRQPWDGDSYAFGENPGGYRTELARGQARAVLEAVADDLRADAWDEGYQAAADDWCTPGVFGRVSRNPYRERADEISPKEDR